MSLSRHLPRLSCNTMLGVMAVLGTIFCVTTAFGLDCPVNDSPRACQGRSVIVSPTIQGGTIKQELPAFGLLFGCKRVLLGGATHQRERGEERGSGPVK